MPVFSTRDRGRNRHHEGKHVERDRYIQERPQEGSFGRFSDVEERRK
jgi:hypothetical protein